MHGSRPHGTNQRAERLCRQGLERQLEGDLDGAVGLYRASLDIAETAEAWCFLGWCLSFQGELEMAVAHCRRAVEVDPGLGNPYNDVGAYLVELGRDDEAIHWFEAAKTADRYETRQFPFLNLARLYIGRRQLHAALLELQAARVLAPADPQVDELITYVGILVEAKRPQAA